jgi:hypothetical protein
MFDNRLSQTGHYGTLLVWLSWSFVRRNASLVKTGRNPAWILLAARLAGMTQGRSRPQACILEFGKALQPGFLRLLAPVPETVKKFPWADDHLSARGTDRAIGWSTAILHLEETTYLVSQIR